MAVIIKANKTEPCCSEVLIGLILDLFGIYHGFYIDLYEITLINRELRQIRPNRHHDGDYQGK